MFKASIAKRSFSSLGARQFLRPTRPRRLEQPNGTAFKYYRVRFQNPPFLTRRRVRSVLLYAGPLLLLRYYVLPVLSEIELDDEDGEGLPPDVKENREAGKGSEDEIQLEDDDEDEDGLFIPCSWPSQAEREFYKGTDPEWQEFVRFSKNKERQRRVFSQIVSEIRGSIDNHPQLRKVMGQVSPSEGRFWIDVTFPHGPPRHYEVSGIEITDKYISWTTRPLGQQDYQKLQQTLTPTAAAYSFWASCQHLFTLQSIKLQQFFGLPLQSNGPFSQTRQALDKNSKQQGLGQSESSKDAGLAGAEKSKSVNPDGSSSQSQSQSSSSSSSSSKNSSSTGNSQPEQTIGLPQLPGLSPDEPQSQALDTFLSTFQRHRKPFAIEPPRGTIILTGFVEVIGKRGRMTIDVTAAYDVMHERLVAMNTKIRRLAESPQVPRG